jgi:hypothetical protein
MTDMNLQGTVPSAIPALSPASWLDIKHRSRNENAEVSADNHTAPCPVEAYKDGRLTISGWLLVVEGCPESQSNFAASAKTPQIAIWCRELLGRWRDAGFPDLGAWPPQGTELLDYSLGVICGVLMSNDKAETPDRKHEH